MGRTERRSDTISFFPPQSGGEPDPELRDASLRARVSALRTAVRIGSSVTLVDLHCDTLRKCYKRGKGLRDNGFAFSLEKIPPDFRMCQAMAVFIPDGIRGSFAENYFDAVYGVYKREIEKHKDIICAVADTRLIGESLLQKPVAAILTVEGGSVLNGKLENVRRIYDMGVRMMTLTWNGENELCGGCATGSGFTAFGRAAVAEMEKIGMIVDVSHLSDRGFYELAGFAERPLVASHSNSRAVCSHPRNLTDDMFRIIMERRGLVGINYYDNFIVEGGGSKTVDDLLRHIHHFLELGGENTLALGSDYDGADIPDYLDSVEKHAFLMEAMERSGIPGRVIEKIRFKNACKFFTGAISN